MTADSTHTNGGPNSASQGREDNLILGVLSTVFLYLYESHLFSYHKLLIFFRELVFFLSWANQSTINASFSDRVTVSLPAINTFLWQVYRNTQHLKGKSDIVTHSPSGTESNYPSFLPPIHCHACPWQTLPIHTQPSGTCRTLLLSSTTDRHDHNSHSAFSHTPASLVQLVAQPALLNAHCFWYTA